MSEKKEWNSFKKQRPCPVPRSGRPSLGWDRSWGLEVPEHRASLSGPLFPTGVEAAHLLWRKTWDQR